MTPIPQTADAFKAWADRECGKWPADLQTLAFNTWTDFRLYTWDQLKNAVLNEARRLAAVNNHGQT